MHHRPSSDEAARFRMASLLWVACITLLLVPMTTLLDMPIARWFARDPLHGLLGDALDLSLIYAHGTGITLILVGLLLLAPRKRWYVPRLAALALGGSAVSTLAKMFVLRPRPNSLNLSGAGNDYAWIWSFDWTLSHVADFDPSSRAFPSAYLATATAMTVGLWVLVPRGRWLFAVLWTGTLFQRLYCGAHFLSDLFGSAAIGLWWSFVCYHPSLMGALFDKLEPEREPRRRLWQPEESSVQDSTDHDPPRESSVPHPRTSIPGLGRPIPIEATRQDGGALKTIPVAKSPEPEPPPQAAPEPNAGINKHAA